jgi:enoyl-CoA hydratase/carnithine racemase
MTLTHRVHEGVLEVCLHREPANEIGLDMLVELERVAELVREGASGARAIIFSSSVPMGFSAGADLRELYAGLQSVKNGNSAWREHAQRLFDRPSTATTAGAATLRGALSNGGLRDLRKTATVWGVRAFLDRIHRVFDTFDAAPIPTIAAVHGVCFGGGFELALTCDVIVADKSARFAFPELRLGLIPGFGGIPRLERDLGNAVVRDLLLSGRSLGAKRAHEVGLVAQLVGEGQALNVARRLAAQTKRFDAHTLSAAKEFAKPMPRARLEREKDVFCHLFTSPAVEEALARFVSSKDAMPYLP